MKKAISVILISLLFFQLVAQLDTSMLTQMLIKVSIVGAVENPGIYKLEPGSRLSEALELLEEGEQSVKPPLSLKSVQQKAENEEEKKQYSLRNLEIRRRGKMIKIDLQKYYCCGRISENPQLMDGDLIYLYPAEYNLEILGAVNSSGRYDLLAGDRISDLIELAQGLSESARKDSASLVRLDYETGETSASIFSPEKVITDTESSDNLFLQSGDRIYIRELAEYDSKYSVTVAGEAVYPGDFAIEPGKTTLYEILKACGGATELGSLKKAWLQRTSAIDSTDTSDPEYLRLMERSLLELTNMEREYLKFKSRQMEGKIAVDFSKLQQREATGSRIFLQDGDQIYIPVKSETVSIIGAVMHPGAYNWEPGQSFDHYIKLAGGYTNRARKQKVRIINDESGAWQKRDKLLVVNAGDQIFVPEKEEEDFWQLTKETLSILAQLATVVIAVVNIYNN